MINVTQSHKEQAEKKAASMAVMGMKYDIEKLALAVAIVEWAKTNEEFKARSGWNHMNVSATDIYGKSEAEAIGYIEKKVTSRKRKAGAQALKNKYGSDAAKRIISKHSKGR